MGLTRRLGYLLRTVFQPKEPGSNSRNPQSITLPILDVRALSETQLTRLASTYEKFASSELNTFPSMADDPIREGVDDAFAKVLGLSSLDKLRAELAAEPVICNHPIGHEVPVQPNDQLQFELI